MALSVTICNNISLRKQIHTFDEAKTIDSEKEIPVQINGKVKATVKITLDEEESSVKAKVIEAITNNEPVSIVYDLFNKE